MNDDHRSKRGLTIPVLLALIVLSQLAIANEIRYQGCISNQFALAQVVKPEDNAEAPDFECSRFPLI